MQQSKPWLAGLISLTIAVVLIFPLLSFTPASEISESREGTVVLEILRSGNYILPLRQGQVVPSKPILFHWIGTLLANLAGHFDEQILRMPSALAAVGILMVTAMLASFCGTTGSGLFAAAILLTSSGFVHLAINGRVDMLFSCWVSLSILLWIWAAARIYERQASPSEMPKWTWHGIGVLTGLAVLTKGPLGFVLPPMVIGMISLSFWKLPGIKSMFRIGWIWAFLIGVPWYLLAILYGKEAFILRQIVFENFQRLVGGEGITPKPWHFYLKHFILEAPPWSILLVIYLFVLGRSLLTHVKMPHEGGCRLNKRFLREFFSIDARLEKLLPPDRKSSFAIIAGLIWILVTVFFFSLSSGKRSGYLLPTASAQALVLSLVLPYYFAGQQEDRWGYWIFKRRIKQLGLFLWGAVLLGLSLFFLLGYFQPDFHYIKGLNPVIASIPNICQRFPLMLVVSTVTFLTLWLFFWQRAFEEHDLKKFGFSIFSLLFLVNTGICPIILALRTFPRTYQAFALQADLAVPEGAVLQVLKDSSDESFESFFYYYKGRIVLREPEEGLREPGYYLARRYWLESKPEIPNLNQVEIIMHGGRPADQESDYLTVFRWPRE